MKCKMHQKRRSFFKLKQESSHTSSVWIRIAEKLKEREVKIRKFMNPCRQIDPACSGSCAWCGPNERPVCSTCTKSQTMIKIYQPYVSWFVVLLPFHYKTSVRKCLIRRFWAAVLQPMFSLLLWYSVHVDRGRRKSLAECSTSRGWRFYRSISSTSRQSTSPSFTRLSRRDWMTTIRSYCEPTAWVC